MTRDKLEYFRHMLHSGQITKDEFRDIENIYHNQDRSFIEIDGKKEIVSKERLRAHEHDSYTAALSRGKVEDFNSENIDKEESVLRKMRRRRSSGLSLRGFLTEFTEEMEKVLKEQTKKNK